MIVFNSTSVIVQIMNECECKPTLKVFNESVIYEIKRSSGIILNKRCILNHYDSYCDMCGECKSYGIK